MMLANLSARVELRDVSNTLRLYSKALTGEQIAIRSTEELVDAGIGWVQESVATTEGNAIYLPPYVGTFPAQVENFASYKVFTTHQTGRIEFGSFRFEFGAHGAFLESTMEQREAASAGHAGKGAGEDGGNGSVAVAPNHADGALLRPLPGPHADRRPVHNRRGRARRRLHRPRVRRHPPRAPAHAGVRGGEPEQPVRAGPARRLPRKPAARLARPAADHPLPRRPDGRCCARASTTSRPPANATPRCRDSAEAAAAIYTIAVQIPNLQGAYDEVDWEALGEEMIDISPDVSGGPGAEVPAGEEVSFETPPQPEFRGDFKPELVQLMMRLQEQRDGSDPAGAPLTQEQLQALLEKSVEITISDIAEGDLASSMGMFLTNLEREALDAKQGPPGQVPDGADAGDSSGEGDAMEDLPIEISWTYYDEWDFRAGDYRPRWCRVGERRGEEGELDYYEDTLRRHHGLVSETRRQFELLRPEHFRRIKRLEDGEDVDIDEAILLHHRQARRRRPHRARLLAAQQGGARRRGRLPARHVGLHRRGDRQAADELPALGRRLRR